MPDSNYMDRQKDLKWKMRSILIDWLVEVHLKFKLSPETLFLTVNLIDRFLTLRSVNRNKFQLVGITAMFIAAKYEEVYAPPISQFVYIADGGFSNDEIIRAERYMLEVLEFKLHYPNPLNFLRRCSKADAYDVQNRTLGKYFMELAMVDHEFLGYNPSMLAAASLYAARAVMNHRQVWTNNLRHYSGYTEADLRPCVLAMLNAASTVTDTSYLAVHNKYTATKYFGASVYVDRWTETHKDSASDDWGLPALKVVAVADSERRMTLQSTMLKALVSQNQHQADDVQQGPFGEHQQCDHEEGDHSGESSDEAPESSDVECEHNSSEGEEDGENEW
jgi:G2/mitotic-specific cyclin 1/2